MNERPGAAAPILPVPDPLAAAHRYESVFGFHRLRYFDGNDEYLVLGRGDAQIHLMKSARANPNHAAGTHVADVFVWVDALDEVVAAARDAGCAITRGPEHYGTSPVATTEVVIEDLDGYWLCFATAG